MEGIRFLITISKCSAAVHLTLIKIKELAVQEEHEIKQINYARYIFKDNFMDGLTNS